MGNVVLNRPVSASGFIYPFTPDRTVNGIISATNRWVCSSTVDAAGTFQPMWLSITLDDTYWINRWVVTQMQQVGWNESYNLSEYRLQGSTDGIHWEDLDVVYNTSSSKTDRTMQHGASVSWVRLYIFKGLKCNNSFASVVNFEVYSTATTSNTLSALVICNSTSNIPTDPPFSPNINNFNAFTSFDTDRVFIIPTATDSNAEVTVDGFVGPSGPIMLTAGDSKTANVVVYPTVGYNNTYSLNITRSSSPYLNDISLALGTSPIPLNPQFKREIFSYIVCIPKNIQNITVTAMAEDSDASININTIAASSGKACNISLLNTSTISVYVSSKVGQDSKIYTINISKM